MNKTLNGEIKIYDISDDQCNVLSLFYQAYDYVLMVELLILRLQ